MTRFICLSIAALAFAFTMLPTGASAQDTPKKNLPSFVTNPFANPLYSSYARQRDLREQQVQDRRIQQLQKLELLKAANNKAKTDKQEAEALPQGSAKYKTAPATSAKSKTGKDGKTMAKATDKDKTSDTPTVVENPLRESGTKPGYSRTTSNYGSLLPKKQ